MKNASQQRTNLFKMYQSGIIQTTKRKKDNESFLALNQALE